MVSPADGSAQGFIIAASTCTRITATATTCAPRIFEVATRISNRTLSLPLSPQVTEYDQDDVVAALAEALADESVRGAVDAPGFSREGAHGRYSVVHPSQSRSDDLWREAPASVFERATTRLLVAPQRPRAARPSAAVSPGG